MISISILECVPKADIKIWRWSERGVFTADLPLYSPANDAAPFKVVPHEVMGMSNFNKNLFVGLGGKEAIDLSHFIGACYGMEKMMGRADNPLRRILNRASDDFLTKLPLVRRDRHRSCLALLCFLLLSLRLLDALGSYVAHLCV